MQYVSRIWESKEEEKMIEYTNSGMILLINEYIHSERDRKILKRRLIDGLTYENLAEEFDLSVTQVKRIVYKGEDIIFKKAR
jgi:5-methylthioribose kinase